jgi:hypothetical protein
MTFIMDETFQWLKRGAPGVEMGPEFEHTKKSDQRPAEQF